MSNLKRTSTMSNTKYTEDHEWVRVEDDDIAVVGITDFAQDQLGELVYVELPEAGSAVSRGDNAAVIESVKAAGEVKSPVSGRIEEVNDALSDAPETVNEDPTGAGWFYKVRITNAGELDGLMDEDAYTAHIKDLG